MRGRRIRGPDDQLARLLQRILVRCEVAGIEERRGELDVWLEDGSPDLPDPGALEVTGIEPVEEGSWTGLEHDRPIAVADDLLVRPPWVERPAGFRGVELVVPRGMAFGSGEHESTRLALLLLREVLGRPGSLADVGTGSGILALYATLRGCAPVLACDTDADAVRAARQLVPSMRVWQAGPGALVADHGPVDHVVANLSGAEILQCLPDLLALWNGRGALMLSGMGPGELAPVLQQLPRAPGLLRRGRAFAAAAVTSVA